VGRRIQANTKRVAFEDRLQAFKAEKQSVQGQLGTQADQILRLQEDDSRNAQQLAELRLALRTMTDRANDAVSAKNRTDEQMRLVSEQRDALSVRLREAEQANQSIQAELASLRRIKDVMAVGLGPRILRADTAALAALACWQSLVGDWQRPTPRLDADYRTSRTAV